MRRKLIMSSLLLLLLFIQSAEIMENVDARVHDAGGRMQSNVKRRLRKTIYRHNSIFHRHKEFAHSRRKKKHTEREEASTKLLINTSFACSSCFTSIRNRHVNCGTVRHI